MKEVARNIEFQPPLFEVTLSLDDHGRCVYQIDGEGEYLRWQVLRKALNPLFFRSE